MTETYLTIVIPAYKEEKRIHKILDAIAKYQKEKEFTIETIVVCDASPDDTAGVVRQYKDKLNDLRVIEGKVNKGKGGAVQEGMLSAKGKYIIFADADNSTPIEQADKLLRFVPKYEVVIGSRYCDGGKLAVSQSLFRRLGGRAMNLAIQTLAIAGISDTQCGFKLFSNQAAKKIFQKQTVFNFSFDIEILVIAKRLGFMIKEVGITWYDDPHSTVSPIRDGVRIIKDSWNIRKNVLAGKYNDV